MNLLTGPPEDSFPLLWKRFTRGALYNGGCNHANPQCLDSVRFIQNRNPFVLQGFRKSNPASLLTFKRLVYQGPDL